MQKNQPITLGLDIGVNSLGWAVIKDDQILDMGVRIVPHDPNFHGKFEKGNPASKNEDRRTKRGARRNLDRYQLRRDRLLSLLKEHGMLPSALVQDRNNPEGPMKEGASALELYGLRAKAVTEKVSLEELGRVFFLLNRKRGFKSNRKTGGTDEKEESEYKKMLSDNEAALKGRTPGQFFYDQLQQNAYETLRGRTWHRHVYRDEFDRVWEQQKKHYPELLTGGPNEAENRDTLYQEIGVKTIFKQRPLKSQKGLVGNCLFEKNLKVVPKSSPLFQYFRTLQQVNNLVIKPKGGRKAESRPPTTEEREALLHKLATGLDRTGKLSSSAALKAMGISYRKYEINYEKLEGLRTRQRFLELLTEAEVAEPESLLAFDYQKVDQEGPLQRLWHLAYSLDEQEHLTNALQRAPFNLSLEQATTVANGANFGADYGRMSAKAIRKLLPPMEKGLLYSEACEEVGYNHTTVSDIVLRPNALRNPVVEQILFQVKNLVDALTEKYKKSGLKVELVRVELARELRNSAKKRNKISRNQAAQERTNNKIRQTLDADQGYKVVNGRDVERYKLWEETEQRCVYCSQTISAGDLHSGMAEIEHILPRSRSRNNTYNNKVLTHRKCNADKGQRTALDFIESSDSKITPEAYQEHLDKLLKAGKISQVKYNNLLTTGEDIPDGFVERQKKDTQYVASATVKLLKQWGYKVETTTGSVTNMLRKQWNLDRVLRELNLERYQPVEGRVYQKAIKDKEQGIKHITAIKDWNKRDDQRHHAVDALIVALTDKKIIFRLNNANKGYQYFMENATTEAKAKLKEALHKAWREEFKDEPFDINDYAKLYDMGSKFQCPIPNLRQQARTHLEGILVSLKKSSKAASLKRNKNDGRMSFVPRGALHEETVLGTTRRLDTVSVKEALKDIDAIEAPQLRELLQARLDRYGTPGKALSKKALEQDPLLWKGGPLTEVAIWKDCYFKRVELNESISEAQVRKIIDPNLRRKVEGRIDQAEGKTFAQKVKTAFADYADNPIISDTKTNAVVKRVRVWEEAALKSVREKADGSAKDFVYTKNNHHALILKDAEGNYYAEMQTLWDAVEQARQEFTETGTISSVILREDPEGLGRDPVFTLQRNDLFVFDLKPEEIDFMDHANYAQISRRLFRVQKMSLAKSGQFKAHFRHHLETEADRWDKDLQGLIWACISSKQEFASITKVRLNNLGQIIKVGE